VAQLVGKEVKAKPFRVKSMLTCRPIAETANSDPDQANAAGTDAISQRTTHWGKEKVKRR
jgi:hypothetical protein